MSGGADGWGPLFGPREPAPIAGAGSEAGQGRLGQPFREFEHVGGVHLTDSILWCDADRKQGLNFRSSADAGEVGRGRRILCTEATLRLISRGKGKLDALTAAYDQRLAVGELELSLHPAGSMLGAAQLRIVRGGRVIVYAGDVGPRAGFVCPPAEPIRCDVLALPATFGQRGVGFPPRDEVMADLRRFLDAALTEGGPVVLLVRALGVGPEVAVGLGRAGYKLRVHRALADVLKIHAELGVLVPPFKRLGKRVGKQEVVLVPPILRGQVPELFPAARVGFVGPRAVDAAHVHQLGVDQAFPLTHVADRQELERFVDETGAGEVFLTGGAIPDFRALLEPKGVVVRDLLPQKQLSLF